MESYVLDKGLSGELGIPITVWALSEEAFGSIFITSSIWGCEGSNPRLHADRANALPIHGNVYDVR